MGRSCHMLLLFCTLPGLQSCIEEPDPHRPEPAEPLVVAVTTEPVASQVFARRLRITTSEPATLTGSCVLDDAGPREAHPLSSDEASTDHELTLLGLLADASYSCGITAGGEHTSTNAVATFETGPPPPRLPAFEVTGAASDPTAYTMFNVWQGDLVDSTRHLVVVDGQGRVRWHHRGPDGAGVGIDLSLHSDGHLLAGGGPQYPPSLIAQDGSIEYVSGPPASGYAFHHHAEELPDGSILTLTKDTNSNADGSQTWTGFAIEARHPDTGELTFHWRSQQAVDAGTLPVPDPEIDDHCHANSVSFVDDDADGPAVWVSCRNISRILRIDRGTGELDWALGPFAMFRLVDRDGSPLGAAQWFWGQHAPEIDYPRVLLYDNGGQRPGGEQYSRAIELELDPVSRTATLLWSWEEPGWYEPLFGDVDALPSGNRLVARGKCFSGCNDFGDPERVADIIEIDPDTDEVVWRLAIGSSDYSLYRADQVGGCELFDNTRYCPD